MGELLVNRRAFCSSFQPLSIKAEYRGILSQSRRRMGDDRGITWKK